MLRRGKKYPLGASCVDKRECKWIWESLRGSRKKSPPGVSVGRGRRLRVGGLQHEATHDVVLPSLVPLLSPGFHCLLGVAPLGLVDFCVTGIADAHKVVPHKRPFAHLRLRCRFLDGVSVMHRVGTGYDALLLAHFAQRVGPQLLDAQLPPFAAVVDFRFVLRLLRRPAPPWQSLRLGHCSTSKGWKRYTLPTSFSYFLFRACTSSLGFCRF